MTIYKKPYLTIIRRRKGTSPSSCSSSAIHPSHHAEFLFYIASLHDYLVPLISRCSSVLTISKISCEMVVNSPDQHCGDMVRLGKMKSAVVFDTRDMTLARFFALYFLFTRYPTFTSYRKSIPPGFEMLERHTRHHMR